jgi:hypothetical protein
MHVFRTILCMLALAGTLGGCATAAYGSAAAPDPNWQYVVGRRSNPAAMWLCPTSHTGQDCQLVDVVLQ